MLCIRDYHAAVTITRLLCKVAFCELGLNDITDLGCCRVLCGDVR